MKAYAGSAPVTRASGKVISITHRRIKNDRLAAVGWVWATTMVVLRGPARQHYRRRRDHGDRHAPAVRHLFNKMLGQLYCCLQTRQTYDPDQSLRRFPPRTPKPCRRVWAEAGGSWTTYSARDIGNESPT